MHRRRVLCVLTFVVVTSGVASTTAPASPRPRTLASYCSSSGDVCFGVIERNGIVYLDLSTVERYFGRYRLCVRAPGATTERCGTYRIRPSGSTWGSSVKLARFAPPRKGRYGVTWKLGTTRLGPMLRFRLPAAR